MFNIFLKNVKNNTLKKQNNMNFIQFNEKMASFSIFSLKDIKKVDPSFDRRRLSEWQEKGYIKKVVKNFYVFSDLQIKEQSLFLIANQIYEPSYVSLEMAFSWHHLIPEGVYTITSVTSKKTTEFKTEFGNFNYKHIKATLLFGYDLVKYDNRNILISDIEKTVLDYIYFNSQIKTVKDFEGLRFNVSEFKEKADMIKFYKYLEMFDNKQMKKRVKSFIKYIENYA